MPDRTPHSECNLPWGLQGQVALVTGGNHGIGAATARVLRAWGAQAGQAIEKGAGIMAYDEGLAQRLREVVEEQPGIAERKMFGGLCFLVSGNMCLGVVKDELMVRVGPDAYETCLAEPHARKMDFTGRAMKGMVAPSRIRRIAASIRCRDTPVSRLILRVISDVIVLKSQSGQDRRSMQ